MSLDSLLFIKHELKETLFKEGIILERHLLRIYSGLRERIPSSMPSSALPHLNLVAEACLYPFVTKEYTLSLMLKQCALFTDKEYISGILAFIDASPLPPGVTSAIFAKFRCDAYTFMANYAKVDQSTRHEWSHVAASTATATTSKMNPAGPVFQPQAPPDYHQQQQQQQRREAQPGRQFTPGSPLLPQIVQPQNQQQPFQQQQAQMRPTIQQQQQAQQLQAQQQVRQQLVLQQKLRQQQEQKQQLRKSPSRFSPGSVAAPTYSESVKQISRSGARMTPETSPVNSTISSILRKNGMDLINPPTLQDRVLCCIYIGTSMALPGEDTDTYPLRTHKELVDAVVEVQNAELLRGPENHQVPLSKTKLRGILGLLKNAGVLIVQHAADDGTYSVASLSANCPAQTSDTVKEVKLQMSSSILVFQDLRDRIDNYLLQWLETQNCSLSDEEQANILWNPADLELNLARVTSFMDLVRPTVKASLMRSQTADAAPETSESDWADLERDLHRSGSSMQSQPLPDLFLSSTQSQLQPQQPSILNKPPPGLSSNNHTPSLMDTLLPPLSMSDEWPSGGAELSFLDETKEPYEPTMNIARVLMGLDEQEQKEGQEQEPRKLPPIREWHTN